MNKFSLPPSPVSIGSLISFAESLFKRKMYCNRRGATNDEIAELVAHSSHRLPALYVDYLSEFGHDSDGFQFARETVSDIASLIGFHEDSPKFGPDYSSPKDCFVFAIAIANDGRAFDFSKAETATHDEPQIVAYYDDAIYNWYAISFQSFLYTETYLAYLAERFTSRVIHRGVLLGRYDHSMQDLVDVAVPLGYSPYWFSDAHRTCLSRGEDEAIIILRDGSRISIDLIFKERADVSDIESLLVKEFSVYRDS